MNSAQSSFIVPSYAPHGKRARMAILKIIRKKGCEIETDSLNLSQPDHERIHTLCIQRRLRGLSPPEEEELILLEGQEAQQTILSCGLDSREE